MRSQGIISILPYKIKMDQEDELYRGYMARCVRILTENTAKMSGGGYLRVEFDEIINPKPKDTRKAEDIVADIIAKAGIEVKTK